MKLSETGKQKVFAEDLAVIQSDEIRNFTLTVLESLPWYFWTQPASTTGKYHPACTLGVGGLLVHTKRVLFFGKKLILAHLKGIQPEKADPIISAMVLHDGQKGGKGYGSYDDYENHPLLVEKRFQITRVFPDWQQEIFSMIRYHMGPWSPEGARKPMSEYTESEIIVYHADYLAAQKDLVTPVDNYIADLNLTWEE